MGFEAILEQSIAVTKYGLPVGPRLCVGRFQFYQREGTQHPCKKYKLNKMIVVTIKNNFI